MKIFGNKAYYYVVENKIINGKPTMKHVAYLGTTEKILQIFHLFKKKKST